MVQLPDNMVHSLVDSGFILEELYIDADDLAAGVFEVFTYAVRWNGSNLEEIKRLDYAACNCSTVLKPDGLYCERYFDDWGPDDDGASVWVHVNVGDYMAAFVEQKYGKWRETGVYVIRAGEMAEYVNLASLLSNEKNR